MNALSGRQKTIGYFEKLVSGFQKKRGWNPPPKSLAISIAIEAAELLEYFQWDDYAKYKNASERAREISEELADVIIYCLQFASTQRIDVAKAIADKMKKNEKKYPNRLFGKNSGNEAEKYYQIKAEHRSRRAKKK